MNRRNNFFLLFIFLLAIATLIVDWPQNPSNYLPGSFWPQSQGIHLLGFDRQGTRLGLDLQGGAFLLYRGDLSKLPPGADPDTAINGAVRVIQNRVNASGTSEATVQRSGTDRLIVELPGIRNVEEAKSLIGKTAQLDFREQTTVNGQQTWIPALGTAPDGTKKPFTGAYLTSADVTFDQVGKPQIAFQLNSEGGELFADITKRLTGKPLGIFLDDQQISAPNVQSAITGGKGVIQGSFTLESARDLAIQLSAGALPVPISVEEERTVDATLGSDSVHKSVVAGELALAIVAIFMIVYYRMLGVVAVAALFVYTLLVMAVFKLVPITLSLAGIAGFILSIGMAVDANILIFERMKEELRAGRTVGSAIDAGFNRAWPSIRDSNFSTLITCAILAFFGAKLGANIVSGFAITLGIGVLASMFSAIVVTRSFLHVVVGRRAVLNPALFGMPSAQPRLGAAGLQR
ncbi:MAG: preprotein translocase subunit SecD [Chloroflexota bacterium]|jgi:preprotein translocase subunit SecD|nr:preprotein translocase subunit SecD [Chloroflexota bacterium]